jgi:hypothetical protein
MLCRDVTFLVKNGETEAIKEIKLWKKNGKMNDEKMKEWQNQGVIICLTEKSDVSDIKIPEKPFSIKSKVQRLPSPISRSNYASYINIGTSE